MEQEHKTYVILSQLRNKIEDAKKNFMMKGAMPTITLVYNLLALQSDRISALEKKAGE